MFLFSCWFVGILCAANISCLSKNICMLLSFPSSWFLVVYGVLYNIHIKKFLLWNYQSFCAVLCVLFVISFRVLFFIFRSVITTLPPSPPHSCPPCFLTLFFSTALYHLVIYLHLPVLLVHVLSLSLLWNVSSLRAVVFVCFIHVCIPNTWNSQTYSKCSINFIEQIKSNLYGTSFLCM